VRGDRNRLVQPYLDSLNKVIALQPRILLPGQEVAVVGKEKIEEQLILIRDALQYVHDEVIKGMNDGKDVYQLMQEIELPRRVAHLSQSHGRVDWVIRNMVYEYGGWFQYRNTSELYPYHVSEVYADVIEIAGVKPVLAKAEARLQAGEPVHALLLIEMAVESEPENPDVLRAQIQVLTTLLERSRATTNNFSEIAWLETEISKAKDMLD
jgi:alkyl sulfatase BDS1-like metallo-beta-lactamase superfamily hydrolase